MFIFIKFLFITILSYIKKIYLYFKLNYIENHCFLPAYSYYPKSCMISATDFSTSSILFPILRDKITHLINPADDIGRHFIKSVLHLF